MVISSETAVVSEVPTVVLSLKSDEVSAELSVVCCVAARVVSDCCEVVSVTGPVQDENAVLRSTSERESAKIFFISIPP